MVVLGNTVSIAFIKARSLSVNTTCGQKPSLVNNCFNLSKTQQKISVCSDSIYANATANVNSVDVTPTISNRGCLYLFFLYVLSIINTTRNIFNNFTDSG